MFCCASPENPATVAFLSHTHDLQISDVPVRTESHVDCSSECAIALGQFADGRQRPSDGAVGKRATSVLTAANNRHQAPFGDDHEHVGDTATFDSRRHIDLESWRAR